jgi:hypothetical protein
LVGEKGRLFTERDAQACKAEDLQGRRKADGK